VTSARERALIAWELWQDSALSTG